MFQITSKLSKSNYGVGDESKTHQVLFDSSNLGSENKQATCHGSYFLTQERFQQTQNNVSLPRLHYRWQQGQYCLSICLFVENGSVCLKVYNPQTIFFLCLIGSTTEKHLSLEG